MESDGSFAFSWLVLVVSKSVSVRLGKIESDLPISVYISDELIVVDLIEVALVHVLFEKKIVERFSWWSQIELFKNSTELILGDVSYFSDIKVLKLRFQV